MCDSPVPWQLWLDSREVAVLRSAWIGYSGYLLRLGRCWARYLADEYAGNCLIWELHRIASSLEVHVYF